MKISTTGKQREIEIACKTQGGIIVVHEVRQGLKEQHNIHEEPHAKEIACRCFTCIHGSHRYNEATWNSYRTAKFTNKSALPGNSVMSPAL